MFDLNEENPEDLKDCPQCHGKGTFTKIMYISAEGTSTSKTSESFPDGVRKFEERRAERKLEKAIRRARKKGDKDTLMQAQKESLERGKIVKGVPDTPITRQYVKDKK